MLSLSYQTNEVSRFAVTTKLYCIKTFDTFSNESLQYNDC